MNQHEISVALGALGGVSGVITAYYWWLSSRIDVDPPSAIPGLPSSVGGDYRETINALQAIGELNKIAAIWSAIAALLFTAATLI